MDTLPASAASATLLQVDHLHFSYPQRALFQHWSARIPAGVGLVRGGDGSGKTTLLRLLAGELGAEQGALVLAGTALGSAPEAYRAQVFWHDPRSDALHQISARDWWHSLPARHSGWQASALAGHVQGLGLEAHLDKPMYQLSSGSQRKVILAAGLASGAALTLIDEPLAGLDRPSIAYLECALAALAVAPAGRCVLVAHYEALRGVPWAVVLDLPDENSAGSDTLGG
ncbi:ABC transporter ATP-binding protein [Simplicispira psychrophila]|uniref:ABC transporter ATP-binding protein n=1 Tax=Simplicispira psychrophila TaxID=80882 RepID=UPI00068E50E4|nr:ATP-binding cassette domain-containing protein [Simplicispira psychrophila]